MNTEMKGSKTFKETSHERPFEINERHGMIYQNTNFQNAQQFKRTALAEIANRWDFFVRLKNKAFLAVFAGWHFMCPKLLWICSFKLKS